MPDTGLPIWHHRVTFGTAEGSTSTTTGFVELDGIFVGEPETVPGHGHAEALMGSKLYVLTQVGNGLSLPTSTRGDSCDSWWTAGPLPRPPVGDSREQRQVGC